MILIYRQILIYLFNRWRIPDIFPLRFSRNSLSTFNFSNLFQSALITSGICEPCHVQRNSVTNSKLRHGASTFAGCDFPSASLFGHTDRETVRRRKSSQWKMDWKQTTRSRGSAAAPCGKWFQPSLPESTICPHDRPAGLGEMHLFSWDTKRRGNSGNYGR